MATTHGIDRSGVGAGSGAPNPSALMQDVLDDATAAEVLTTLGLDTDLLTLSIPANVTVSDYIKTLLDDLTATGARTTLEVGSVSAVTGVAGTNTVTGTIPATHLSYVTGGLYAMVPANTNTGATTVNLTPSGSSALGAKNVFWNGAACVGGELRQNIPAILLYDGTQFHIVANGFNAPFLDTHAVVQGSADSTKKLRLEVDTLTTATTRVWNVQDRDISPGKFPTRQVFTSGSGTYTTPSGCIYIRVRLVGGGGGGSGRDANSGATGSNTTFSTFTASGGAGGTQGGAGGAGGAAAGGDINIPGGGGAGFMVNTSASVAPPGGLGGNSVFGGGGRGVINATGANGATNSGGGGAGAGGTNSVSGGAGGGAGGYVESLISTPAGTYSYAVGAGGAGGAAGGQAGGSGAAGIIIVDEFYA